MTFACVPFVLVWLTFALSPPGVSSTSFNTARRLEDIEPTNYYSYENNNNNFNYDQNNNDQNNNNDNNNNGNYNNDNKNNNNAYYANNKNYQNINNNNANNYHNYNGNYNQNSNNFNYFFDGNNYPAQASDETIEWLSAYSARFQGCQQSKQYNYDAELPEEVRIRSLRLIRYKLCPSDTCPSTTNPTDFCYNQMGFLEYGDYIVDISSFLRTYFQAKVDAQDFDCDYLLNSVCTPLCEMMDPDGTLLCMWDCLQQHNMLFCKDFDEDTVSALQIKGESEGRDFLFIQFQHFFDCAPFTYRRSSPGPAHTTNQSPPDDFNNQDSQTKASNSYNDNAQENNESVNNFVHEDVQVFIGPYCAEQGSEVRLGIFRDNTCTIFIDYGEMILEQELGISLPYSGTSLIQRDCRSCDSTDRSKTIDSNNYNNNNNQNYYYQSSKDDFQDLYKVSGKCEAHFLVKVHQDNAACAYLEGVNIRSVTVTESSHSSVSIPVVASALVFLIMVALTCILKIKVDAAHNRDFASAAASGKSGDQREEEDDLTLVVSDYEDAKPDT